MHNRLCLSRRRSPKRNLPPTLIHPHLPSLVEKIEAITAPPPILRRHDQTALHPITVHIPQFLHPLLLRPNIEVIEAGLPERRTHRSPSNSSVWRGSHGLIFRQCPDFCQKSPWREPPVCLRRRLYRSRPEVIWCFLRERERIFLVEGFNADCKAPLWQGLRGLVTALLYSFSYRQGQPHRDLDHPS